MHCARFAAHKREFSGVKSFPPPRRITDLSKITSRMYYIDHGTENKHFPTQKEPMEVIF